MDISQNNKPNELYNSRNRSSIDQIKHKNRLTSSHLGDPNDLFDIEINCLLQKIT